ncbi:hypothetical protein, partial [Sphingopyxis sp. LC363]|uniref:hypothetical protein n=1 Tax=Sphingopyxis sp. LC363 TaxID=1120705 RepID=UPI001F1E1C3B
SPSPSLRDTPRHPGEGRDLVLSVYRTGEIPAFAGMTVKLMTAPHPKAVPVVATAAPRRNS